MSIDISKCDNNFQDRLSKVIKDDTQTVVSNKLKCSRTLISKYLNGETPEAFIFLKNLAEQYQVDINWLLTGNITNFVERLYERHCKFTERLCTYILPHLNDLIEEETKTRDLLDSENLTQEQKEKYEDHLKKVKADKNKTISDLKLVQEFPWGGNSYDDDPLKTYETFILGGENPTELPKKKE